MSDLTRVAPRSVLESLLGAPDLPAIVPRLASEQLHRVIEQEGLEACGPLIVLATPAQLTELADLDLWRSDRAGTDAALDADRFVEWLDALLEQGPPAAARTLAAMDAGLVAAGLAAYARVLDWAAVSPYPHTDGDYVEPMASLDTDRAIELGSFLLVPRDATLPDAIVDAMRALAAEQPAAFADVMQRVRARSSAGGELDYLDALLDAGRQSLHDLAIEREVRRERRGFATPADARAFLGQARRPRPHPHRVWGAAGGDATALVDTGSLAYLRDYLAATAAQADAHADALAFLGNTLLAGCAVRGRALTPHEASDAAAATCNLGLGRCRSGAGPPPNLVAAFEVGWSLLYREVALFTAERLSDVLADVADGHPVLAGDLAELQRALIREWRAGTPWTVREPLEVVAMLDPPTWAALDGLMAECPVLHAAVRASATPGAARVDALAFEWIADEPQLALIRRFVDSLAARLRR